MAQYNSENTLQSLFPILIVLIVLVAGIVIMPTLTADNRGRASEPKPSPTKASVSQPNNSQQPEIVCSELYSPVCGSDGKTYPNVCEANLAGIKSSTEGECAQNTPISLPSTN